jgi:hypothetical protein
MVVALPSSADLAALADSHPDMGFIAIGIPGLDAGPNLSVIGPQGFRPDQQGFAAGYLAAMLTEDWRMGVISTGETADGRAARLGFLNGAIFFCGLCRPAFPPFVLYPTFAEIPGNGDAATWQPAIQSLVGEAVQTVYLPPAVDDPDLLQLLSEAGFRVITGLPGEGESGSSVIASVGADPSEALETLWAGMLDGEPGQLLPMPIVVTGEDSDLLSPGRLGLLETLIADLMAGIADTGVDPASGDPR